MSKDKPCRGSSLAKGYGCGKPLKFFETNGIKTYHAVHGLCKSNCYPDWLLNSDNGKLKLQGAMLKVQKPVFDLAKAKKESTDWNKKLQVKVNQIVRLIDKGQPCPAKGIMAKQFHAGHVYSRGSNGTIRLNLHNIHRQSAQSNHFQNEDGLFREGLTKEYGQEYFNFISGLRRTKALILSNNELHLLYKKASKIYLKYLKIGQEYNLEQRIQLRNEINIELGIYENEFCVFPYTVVEQ